MFKLELTPNKSNPIDLLRQQMDLHDKYYKPDFNKSISTNSSIKDYTSKSNDDDDHNLTNESLGDDEFQQRVGSAEFTSNSSDDESNESNESSDDSRSEDEPTLSHSYGQMNNRGSASINRSFKPKNKEDLFLKSLAPKKLFVRNRNKNEIEQTDVKDCLNVPKICFDEQTANGNQQNHLNLNFSTIDSNKNHHQTGTFESKTIKAVTRYIDAQGKKAANLTKQQSQSMVNLSSNLSIEGDENQESCSGDDRKQATDNQQYQKQNQIDQKHLNHATSAIRSIIESQYAVLQQENSSQKQKQNTDGNKKRKKGNKLKMNYLHQNADDIIIHSGQISPRSDCMPNGKQNLFDTIDNQSIMDSTCKLEKQHSLHYLDDDKKTKLHDQNLNLVNNNLSQENKNVNRTAKAMNDYLNLNTSNNTSNSSTNSTTGDNDLTSKVTATQNKIEQQQNDENNTNESNLERKSQQFNCLPSRSTNFQNDNISNLNSNEMTNISNHYQLRSLSIQAPDCPIERIHFYKYFSQIVRRGKKNLQNMDSKQFLNSTSKFGGFFELVYKQELRDLVWLEIKAWMANNSSMIEHDAYLCNQRKKIPKTLDKLMRFSVNYQHLNENNYQEKLSKLSNEQKQLINENLNSNNNNNNIENNNNLNNIYNKNELNCDEQHKSTVVEQFKLNESKTLNRSSNENVMLSGNEVNDLKTFIDQDTLAASVALKLTMNESANLENSTNKNLEKDYLGIESPTVEDDNCNCSETLSRLCQYCVDKETTALQQVTKMLNEIDEIEQLYPCVKALAIDYPLYESEQFISRIKSLYLYQNIIRDVREKINLLAKLFHIHNNREAAGWPNFHDQINLPNEFSYNTSSDCTPEIFNITNRDNDSVKSGYSYKLNAPAAPANNYVKQVHFNLSAAEELRLANQQQREQQLQQQQQQHCLDSPDAQMHNIINLNGPQSADEMKTTNPFFPQKVSIYRRFVDKSLKHKGLRYIYHQLSHILRPLLYRVHAALKKPATLNFSDQNSSAATTNYVQPPQSQNTSTAKLDTKLDNYHCDQCNNTKMVEGKLCECNFNGQANKSTANNQANTTNKDQSNTNIPEDYSNELSQFGVWSIGYQQMGLPTFHRPFFFLLRVTIDVIHECLILRLEQQPDKPSNVVLGQLIKECKEVIKASVQIKQLYVNLAQIVLGEAGNDFFEAQLDSFNDDLKTMLIVYLKYLEQYMVCMTKQTSKSNSTLKQKGYLEQEWSFVRSFCPYIPGGEALAANKFCVLASDLLISIGDYIQNGVTDSFKIFKESLQFSASDESSFRKGILSSCRSFKLIFQEANAKVCQATAFAKSLRKDLEIAAEYKILTSVNELLEKLKCTGHIRVIAPNCCNHLLFIPNYMQQDYDGIWQLLDMTCGGRSILNELEHLESTPGYLLITALSNDCQWSGNQIYLEPTPEVILSLSHVEPIGNVFFLVNNPAQLTNRCRQFSNLMMGNLKILKHQTSCNNAIANALTELKNEALKIQDKTASSLDLIYRELDLTNVSNIEESDKPILQMRCLDVLHQGFKFTFEYEKALTRLITGESRVNLAKQLIKFAFQWMTFVMNKCERGRGLRARWVVSGLQYLSVALEPQYVQVLNCSEFKTLKEEVDKFLTFIIGSKERSPKIMLPQSTLNLQGPYSVLNAEINKPLASSLNFQRSQSVVNVKGMFGELNFLDKHNETSGYKGTRLEDWLAKKIASNGTLLHRKRNKFVNKLEAISSHASEIETPTSNTISTKESSVVNGTTNELIKNQSIYNTSTNTSYLNNKLTNYHLNQNSTKIEKMDKIRLAIQEVDDKRDYRLKEKGTIGSVSDLVIQRASFQVAAKKVSFPWQRGFKIGEGRFGKVYTCVNNATGELIAMKEIHLQHSNDNRAIKETIDEIMIFEKIKHPNLVKYFGVEIHRNELFIFMEYCNEGSLESAVQLRLPEQLVRKYTRQLLEAVNCLHENQVIHRDIKSANIFLTLNGNLKLGDFGCCMKLKNLSTMPGELSTLVGTASYMAPEVFTKNSIEGHGRSSDIWSIGCVVLEMLTGLRPWHDLENAYQIMFKVGMGESPMSTEMCKEICLEGLSFLNHCLRHDPRLRWSTGQLLGHPFAKMVEEDDD